MGGYPENRWYRVRLGGGWMAHSDRLLVLAPSHVEAHQEALQTWAERDIATKGLTVTITSVYPEAHELVAWCARKDASGSLLEALVESLKPEIKSRAMEVVERSSAPDKDTCRAGFLLSNQREEVITTLAVWQSLLAA